MSGIAKTTKSEKLAELKTPLDPDAWHEVVMEIQGDPYRARRTFAGIKSGGPCGFGCKGEGQCLCPAR